MMKAEAHVLHDLEAVGLKPNLSETEVRGEIDAGRQS